MSANDPRREEQIAAEGLNIRGYHGKWKRAQEIVSDGKDGTEDGRRLLPYWERVRLLFLELGGEFTDEHQE